MRDSPPALPIRVYRKLRGLGLRSRARQFLNEMAVDNPLKGLAVRVVGDASGDPTEFFDHYDGFAFWVVKKLSNSPTFIHRILDLGSPKMMCGMLSVNNSVTSMVLEDCSDALSNVQYVQHDVSYPFPFDAASFDVFTSTVALPLVGLGRYGDRLDANCLPHVVRELDRVMASNGDLYISMCLGPNLLAFNNGWFLDLETISRLFSGWVLTEIIVDWWSSPRTSPIGPLQERFGPDVKRHPIALGDYRVTFLHFKRADA